MIFITKNKPHLHRLDFKELESWISRSKFVDIIKVVDAYLLINHLNVSNFTKCLITEAFIEYLEFNDMEYETWDK